MTSVLHLALLFGFPGVCFVTNGLRFIPVALRLFVDAVMFFGLVHAAVHALPLRVILMPLTPFGVPVISVYWYFHFALFGLPRLTHL